MFSLGALAFAAPLWLAGLLALPLLARWLRTMPPPPAVVVFPPLRLMAGLETRRSAAQRIPLWLLLLRLALIACLLLIAAQPRWQPQGDARLDRSPMVIMVDNGWESLFSWQPMMALLDRQVQHSLRQEQPVYVVPLAGDVPTKPRPLTPARWQQLQSRLRPQPWPAYVDAALDAYPAKAQWRLLGSGLYHAGLQPALGRLQQQNGSIILAPGTDVPAFILRSARYDNAMLSLEGQPLRTANRLYVKLYGRAGNLLSQTSVDGAPPFRLPIPPAVMKDVHWLQVGNKASLGTRWPVDSRTARPVTGIINSSSSRGLLDSSTYLQQALQESFTVESGSVPTLLNKTTPPGVLFWPGEYVLSPQHAALLLQWVTDGGLLVRFASDTMLDSAADNDALLPLALRPTPRRTGGTLDWEKSPVILSPAAESPLAGLQLPETPLEITGTVLPATPRLPAATTAWLTLSDGTPLVTAARRGAGTVALVHTTANTSWSDFVLSGSFVHMLQKLAELGRSSGRFLPELSLRRLLDASGTLVKPSAQLRQRQLPATPGQPLRHTLPAGVYGDDSGHRFHRLAPPVLPAYQLLAQAAGGLSISQTLETREQDLRRPLLILTMLLLLTDMLASGLLARQRRRWTAPVAVLLLILASGKPGMAQELPVQDRLAYWQTGDSETDTASEAGLAALTRVLLQRTSVAMAGPVAVDASTEDIARYPVLYWPWTPGTPVPPEEKTVTTLQSYIRQQGLLLLDTRSAGFTTSKSDADRWVSALTSRLGLPDAAPLSANHVLSRTYYLLKQFPGRWAGAPLLAVPPLPGSDNVSPVLVGSNDYAAAWATQPGTAYGMYQPVPGGDVQREMAYRVGVNIVLYALTGNYKSDQVHLDTLLKRLGQEVER